MKRKLEFFATEKLLDIASLQLNPDQSSKWFYDNFTALIKLNNASGQSNYLVKIINKLTHVNSLAEAVSYIQQIQKYFLIQTSENAALLIAALINQVLFLKCKLSIAHLLFSSKNAIEVIFSNVLNPKRKIFYSKLNFNGSLYEKCQDNMSLIYKQLGSIDVESLQKRLENPALYDRTAPVSLNSSPSAFFSVCPTDCDTNALTIEQMQVVDTEDADSKESPQGYIHHLPNPLITPVILDPANVLYIKHQFLREFSSRYLQCLYTVKSTEKWAVFLAIFDEEFTVKLFKSNLTSITDINVCIFWMNQEHVLHFLGFLLCQNPQQHVNNPRKIFDESFIKKLQLDDMALRNQLFQEASSPLRYILAVYMERYDNQCAQKAMPASDNSVASASLN